MGPALGNKYGRTLPFTFLNLTVSDGKQTGKVKVKLRL